MSLSEISAVGLLLPVIASTFLTGTRAEERFPPADGPGVVWLILLGMVPGPFARLSARAEIGLANPPFAALAMIVILTDGASGLGLRELIRPAPRATLPRIFTFSLSTLVAASGTEGPQVIVIARGAMTIVPVAVGLPTATRRMGATSSGTAVEETGGPELDGRAGKREEFSQLGGRVFRKSGSAGRMSINGTSGAGAV